MQTSIPGQPCLIGIPYDASSSFARGAALAPQVIRDSLHSPAGNMWTERLFDLATADGLEDAGDVMLGDGEPARETIRNRITDVLAKNLRPIVLGGDHSITFPVVQAVHAAHPDLTILHFDAHPDLYDELDGDRYSHACPFARIMERHLANRLVQVGIRCMTGHQAEQAAQFGVEIIDMHAWAAGTRPVVGGDVYLSLDLDALDPAYAPGVSHREPGGLSVRDILGVIDTCGGTLVGADIVEYNPDRDVMDVTARVAAKFIKEVAGRMLRDSHSIPGLGT